LSYGRFPAMPGSNIPTSVRSSD